MVPCVVSYRNSTSNHNLFETSMAIRRLYLIEILHQTTTPAVLLLLPVALYLIEILHQTTTQAPPPLIPLLVVSYRNSTSNHNRNLGYPEDRRVVSYRNSTSNHNRSGVNMTAETVVSYRNSTSNHNNGGNLSLSFMVVSYRNSTSNHNSGNGYPVAKLLYLIEILHQTTTLNPSYAPLTGCILSKFYIKPQHITPDYLSYRVVSYRNSTSNHNNARRQWRFQQVVSYRNSTSNHNGAVVRIFDEGVVSYRNSTSNHNNYVWDKMEYELYLIEILHQTTTDTGVVMFPPALYLIEILHQTTTLQKPVNTFVGCILSKFYIKPQLFGFPPQRPYVVSYRNSTSNHNGLSNPKYLHPVVSYRNSTSNHNGEPRRSTPGALYLIEILHQTTTRLRPCQEVPELYLIEILHQTTTKHPALRHSMRCILSKFYIKPQLRGSRLRQPYCCILSKFYIKPQLRVQTCKQAIRCILSKFYIKPQQDFASGLRWMVVSYRNSTSNHNYRGKKRIVVAVVSYRNSTSNHNGYLNGLNPS